MEPLTAKPLDLIRIGEEFWEVEGIHLGGERQESIVGVRRLDYSPPVAHGERVSGMVPDVMLRALFHTGVARLYARQ